MDDLTLRYYDAEMRYLLEADEEFARVRPDRAAMLNLDKADARDPYVERLFEGFAFLMGRLREKLDDDLPELTEGLVSLLWPHYLRTIPSMSVVAFTPKWRGPSGLHNTWLILGGEAFDNHTVSPDESLSLTLTGTNGQLPRRALQSTVLDTTVKTTSVDITVRNLCAPTLPCYPPDRDRFHWRVLSHLGSSFLSMMDSPEVLRGTLALYEWTNSEMNRRRLEAIIGVSHGETSRFEEGHLLRGVQIEVTLDSGGFAGRGDICLFGEMLSRFFALYTDIYLFNRLILILQPTGERLEWQEKHNRRIPG